MLSKNPLSNKPILLPDEWSASQQRPYLERLSKDSCVYVVTDGEKFKGVWCCCNDEQLFPLRDTVQDCLDDLAKVVPDFLPPEISSITSGCCQVLNYHTASPINIIVNDGLVTGCQEHLDDGSTIEVISDDDGAFSARLICGEVIIVEVFWHCCIDDALSELEEILPEFSNCRWSRMVLGV
jgi:hypothetical protein